MPYNTTNQSTIKNSLVSGPEFLILYNVKENIKKRNNNRMLK